MLEPLVGGDKKASSTHPGWFMGQFYRQRDEIRLLQAPVQANAQLLGQGLQLSHTSGRSLGS